MIGLGHGRTDAGNRCGGGGVEPLQPRDRPAGDGRQAGAPGGASADRSRRAAAQALALAARHGTVDPRLAPAGTRAAAGSAGGRAAGARRRPAGAAVLRRAHARRARGALRARGDGGDRARRARRGADRAPAQHRAHLRGADDHARPRGLGRGEPVAVSAAGAGSRQRGGDDARRGPGLRLERRGDEARLR